LLDDAAIMDDFDSKVTTNNGVHTLGSNVHIEVSIPVAPTLDNTVMYEFGGSTRFEAFASSVPEPCGGAIFATLALLLPCSWFGRHSGRRWENSARSQSPQPHNRPQHHGNQRRSY
jgi:hypothetical protein